MNQLIKFTAADCEGIAQATGVMVFKVLCDRGMEPGQAAEIVERLEDTLREFLEDELLGDEE